MCLLLPGCVDVGGRVRVGVDNAPCLGFPSLCEPSVYVHASGLCRGCQGVGCGGMELSGVFVVLLHLGRVGKLGYMVGCCVSVVWGAGFYVCVVSVACVISHVSIFMSGACPSIWQLWFLGGTP
jgi:hypothetical protein